MSDGDDEAMDSDSQEWSFETFDAQGANGEALAAASELLARLAAGGLLDAELLERVIVPVFSGLARDPSRELAWYFPKPVADYRALHALNACRLAMYFGLAGRMEHAKVVQLGVVGLLYDCGMWLEDMPPVLEPRAMNIDEMRSVEAAAAHGADLLESAGGIDGVCALAAREHHERADGNGYPARTSAAEQHPYSRLMQVIDSFLGMIEPRPFRKAVDPAQAMQRIAVQARRGYYHAPTFREWVKVMSVWPVGSFVILNTGELALVTGCGANHARPRVSVLADELLEFRLKPMPIDLAEESAFDITGPFTAFPKASAKKK